MSRLERVAEVVEAAHEAMVQAWVWGLSLTVVLFMLVIFNEFAENGWIDQTAVEGLRPIFHIITGISLFGIFLLIVSTALWVGVYFQERETA